MVNKGSKSGTSPFENKNRLFLLTLGEKIDSELFNRKFNSVEMKTRKRTDSVTKSNIMVITGEHWPSMGPSGIGAFHPAKETPIGTIGHTHEPRLNVGIDLKKAMKVRMSGVPVELINNDMKLVVTTGCNVLSKSLKSAQFFHGKFPNALVLGWSTGSTVHKKNYMNEFFKELPDNIDINKNMDLIVDKWKKHIEKMEASSNPNWRDASKRSPGYMTPQGKVFIYKDGKWKESR